MIQQAISTETKSVIFVPRIELPPPEFLRKTRDTIGPCYNGLKWPWKRPRIDYSAIQILAVMQPFWARLTSHCIGIHADLFQQVGGWDTNFEGWGEEDTELFYRLHLMGAHFTVLRKLSAYVRHQWHEVDYAKNRASLTSNAFYFMDKFPEVKTLRRAFYVQQGILP